jgi:hypothetical protein
VEYLGHIFDKDVVRVDPKKIEAMKGWPHPKTLKILPGFLGLTRYYYNFVHNYGKNCCTPDPGVSHWPPTYSNWIKTFCWQVTIFSIFSVPKLPGAF